MADWLVRLEFRDLRERAARRCTAVADMTPRPAA